jgi:mannose-6-phosphate isomerase-like protein (cupin superfamily)
MESMRLEDASPVVAPDGCTVLPLVAVDTGSMVHCTLEMGKTSQAVRHREVREIWYFIRGAGEVWRRDPLGNERVDECRPGLCITIPEGVSFQFRNVGDERLEFLCVTMPPWPGEHVATVVAGKWQPSV